MRREYALGELILGRLELRSNTSLTIVKAVCVLCGSAERSEHEQHVAICALQALCELMGIDWRALSMVSTAPPITHPADKWIAWRGSVSDLATDLRPLLNDNQRVELIYDLGGKTER